MLPEEKKVEEPQGEKPEEKAAEKTAPTIEELQKKLAEAEQRAANKAEEAARHYKKVEAFEKAEKERADKELSKEQLAEKRQAEERAKADQVLLDAQKIVAESETKLLKAAFLLKAKDMGFENPVDAFTLAEKTVTKKEDGEYDEASIEAALKPLIGRLPVKALGDGKGTPRLPQKGLEKQKSKEGRVYNRPF